MMQNGIKWWGIGGEVRAVAEATKGDKAGKSFAQRAACIAERTCVIGKMSRFARENRQYRIANALDTLAGIGYWPDCESPTVYLHRDNEYSRMRCHDGYICPDLYDKLDGSRECLRPDGSAYGFRSYESCLDAMLDLAYGVIELSSDGAFERVEQNDVPTNA